MARPRRRPSYSRPPIRPSPTAARCRGRSRPGRPARIGAALVVLRHGVPLVWHDRRSHHLVTFDSAAVDHEWASALAALVEDGRARSVEIRKVNGASVAESADGAWVTEIARRAGFTDGYRGLILRTADR